MRTLVHILLGTVSVLFTAFFLRGHVSVDSFLTAMLVAIVLAVVSAFLGPLLLILTLPLNIMTLGLFTFVIIGALVLITDAIVVGFMVDGLGWAMVFALVLVVINAIFEAIAHDD